jgi:beta-phosphoglucomutase-like phosphatase (HAD superfamily)
LRSLGREFAVVANPDYVHPGLELQPLAPRRRRLDGALAAAVMDMDGTTTTTEPLCLHSLEHMVRRMTGDSGWAGFSAEDHRHVIGNSTTRHVEYLLQAYRDRVNPATALPAFVAGALWTILWGPDERRREEALVNLGRLGLAGLAARPRVAEFRETAPAGSLPDDALVRRLLRGRRLVEFDPVLLVQMGIDIYYQRYHEILRRLEGGEGRQVSREVFGQEDRRLIEPMPGVWAFLALIRGWLGADAGLLLSELVQGYERKTGRRLRPQPAAAARLAALGQAFEARPARTALVTSSIAYEARVVMREVFRVMAAETASDRLPAPLRRRLRGRFEDYRQSYDAVVTASDSSEMRLKPQRDLYSTALHLLGLGHGDFAKVAGFEDSESGAIAIRAAGIGLCVAVPFAETSTHDLSAAAHVCRGGLPEVVLRHGLFLPAGGGR